MVPAHLTSRMADNVTARTDKDHRIALEKMVTNGEADSLSEALRQTSQDGLRDRGYLNGGAPMTGLRRGVRMVGYWFVLFTAAWVGLTYFYALEFRLPAVFFVLAALTCFAVDYGLRHVEPNVSRRLAGLVGGEGA